MIVHPDNIDPHVFDGADDGRRLSVEERQSRKKLALELHRQGLTPRHIARQVGLSVGTIRTLLKCGHYSEPAPAGRRSGSGRMLSPEQEHEVRVFMRRHSPIGSSDTGKLWTRAAVTNFIGAKVSLEPPGAYEKAWSVAMTRRGVDGYLSRWGISVEHAVKVPSQRTARSIRNWLKANETMVQGLATTPLTHLLWLNGPKEMSTAKDWHPADTVLKSKKVHLLTAETSNGTLFWRLFDGPVRPKTQIMFFNILVQCFRKVVLIRMRSPIYHSAEVLSHVEKSGGKITLLPPREQIVGPANDLE